MRCPEICDDSDATSSSTRNTRNLSEVSLVGSCGGDSLCTNPVAVAASPAPDSHTHTRRHISRWHSQYTQKEERRTGLSESISIVPSARGVPSPIRGWSSACKAPCLSPRAIRQRSPRKVSCGQDCLLQECLQCVSISITSSLPAPGPLKNQTGHVSNIRTNRRWFKERL